MKKLLSNIFVISLILLSNFALIHKSFAEEEIANDPKSIANGEQTSQNVGAGKGEAVTKETPSSQSFAHKKTSQKLEISDGFADVIEPLLPAVVNIYTVYYNKDEGQSNLIFPKTPFDQFNEFFEKFGSPDNFGEFFGERKVESLGSGFIIDPKGYIVTNNHVIKDADEINIKINDVTELNARVIGTDNKTDLALLKVDFDKDLPYVKFGNSEATRVGDWIIAIGNPFGLGGTVTSGIISSKARDIDLSSKGIVDNFLQTDAAINRGNSGGPMFNMKGEVIGVNTAIYSPSGANVGIGFAIPSDLAQKIITELKEHGTIKRGMLNVIIQKVTKEIAESLGLEQAYGALVVDVNKGGAGDKAGLKTGDIIIEYAGQKIDKYRKLPRLVAETALNQEQDIKIVRNGKTINLKVKLEEAAESDSKKGPGSKSMQSPDGSIIKHGVTISNLSNELRKKYGVSDDAKGVVITNIAPYSQWASKGLLHGDLITSVNQQDISSVKELEEIYDKAVKDGKKNVLLLVKRQNATLFIAAPLVKDKKKD